MHGDTANVLALCRNGQPHVHSLYCQSQHLEFIYMSLYMYNVLVHPLHMSMYMYIHVHVRYVLNVHVPYFF